MTAPAAEPIVAEVAGVRLRWHARKLRGDRSLVDAAALVGLNRDELGRIERGETTQIRFRTLAKLLAGYNCTLTDLVEVELTDDTRPAPLYAGVVAALHDGLILGSAPQRRAVRRDTSNDVLAPGEELTYVCADPSPPRRRRSPVGTLHR